MLNRAESPDTPCSTGLEDRIARLEKDFEELVDLIEESFIDNRVSLIKVQKSIKHIPISLKMDLGEYFQDKVISIQSMEGLFFFLSKFWDYLNPGLLEFLVGRFGSKSDIQLLSVYLKKLELFRSSVKLGDFVQSRPSFKDINTCRYKKITMVMGQSWKGKTLQDAENFKNELAEECSIQPFLTRIHANRSSIALVFYLPLWFEVKMEELAMGSFFKIRNVSEVNLDGVCFFDWTKQV